MLERFTAWLYQLFAELVEAIQGLMHDLVVLVIDAQTAVIAPVLDLIPIPPGLAGGLGAQWAALGPGIRYFATELGFVQGMAIIGAGYAIYFARKTSTLFKW